MKKDFWEKAHKTDLCSHWETLSEKKMFLLKELKKFKFPKNARALDVGCSTGSYSLLLAKHGFKVIGLDVSKTAIAIAKKKAKKQKTKNAVFQLKDFFDFNSKNQFDLIIDFSCFTHFEKKLWKKYFAKINKLLKKDGIFLLSLWDKNSNYAYGVSPNKLKKNCFTVKIAGCGLMYTNIFTKKIIQKLFKPGFKIIEIREVCLKSHKNPGLKIFFVSLKKR